MNIQKDNSFTKLYLRYFLTVYPSPDEIYATFVKYFPYPILQLPNCTDWRHETWSLLIIIPLMSGWKKELCSDWFVCATTIS